MEEISWTICSFSSRTRYSLVTSVVVCLVITLGSAFATPKRLDCQLTTLETKAGDKTDGAVENRLISVVIDPDANAIIVIDGAASRKLDNVGVSQISMSGSVDDISVGIDRSSQSVVLQTYRSDTVLSEFGICHDSTEPHDQGLWEMLEYAIS